MIVDLPTALAASSGRSGTAISCTGARGEISEQADRPLRERQHEGRLREGDRAQQRLDVEAIGDGHGSLEVIGEAEASGARRGSRSGEAVRLVRPEPVVVEQILERLADPAGIPALEIERLDPFHRLADRVL